MYNKKKDLLQQHLAAIAILMTTLRKTQQKA
jgi:hypothetical protein